MSVEFRTRSNEGCEDQPSLLWDSIWSPGEGLANWSLAGPAEPLNRGGLRARAALHTAVVLCLFTWRRIPDDHPLRKYVDGDPGGYWGDGIDVRVDLGETPMGSYLHAFRRAPLDETIRRWIEVVALEALQPLFAQGACVRIEAQAIMHAAVDRVELAVQLYGRDGTKIYDQKFDQVWKQAQQ